LGPAFAELGGALADWAYVFRYEQSVKLADRVRLIHKQRGIEGRTIPIPPRLGIPLLQQATLEDDALLLDMWAALIANATDPTRATEARRSYCGLLSSMEPLDALVLAEVYRWKLMYPDRQVLISGVASRDSEQVKNAVKWPNLRNLIADLRQEEDAIVLSLENLERLGLIFDYLPTHVEDDGENGGPAPTSVPIPGQILPVVHEQALIDLTHTGLALMTACGI
jgi:hypothetical protein